MLYRIENQWQGVASGAYVQVYAGSETSDSSQGVLAIAVTSLDLKPVANAGGTYRTPVKAGAVRFTAAQGERLTLEAEDGSVFIFDVASRRFLSP